MTWKSLRDTPNKAGMIIYAIPKKDGTWGLGLAYLTVSGVYRDIHGHSMENATLWHDMPKPPTGYES